MHIPADAVVALLDNAAVRSGCDTFGLQMAQSRRLADFGPVSLLITHQPTLRDALETTIRYSHLLNEALVMEIEESGDLAIIRSEVVVKSPSSVRQAQDLAIEALFRLFRTLLGPRWQPVCVNFAHSVPKDLSLHRKLFGPVLQFESEFNGIVIAAADLEQPNRAADPALALYARQFVEATSPNARPSTTHEVRKAAYLLMPLGRASIAIISRSLGVNARVLQRRLAAEGSEFTEILSTVRQELAVRYLANPAYTITQISRLLGYGQLSSFTRWFLARFGVPPLQWRRLEDRKSA